MGIVGGRSRGPGDHGSQTGLLDDDHTQYHNDSRADTWLSGKSTSDLAEGTNLYFTDERVDDRVNALLVAGTNITLTYDDGAGTLTIDAAGGGVTDHGALTGLGDDDHSIYHTDARALTWLGTRSTSDLSEGTNLYFTDERVDDRVSALIQNGTGISWTYNDVANTLTGAVSLSPFSTSDLSEGTNLYFTDERVDDRVNALLVAGTGISKAYNDAANTLTLSVDASGVDHGGLSGLGDDDHSIYHTDARALTWLGTRSTSDLSEGTNLYFTDERVDDRTASLIQNGTGISWTYNDVANTLTPAVSLSSFSTSDLSEGTNLYHTTERVQDAVGAMATDSASVDFTYNDAAGTLTAVVLPAGVDHGGLGGLGDDDHSIYHTDARALTWLGTRSTTDLPEGTNLYHTQERVEDVVGALVSNTASVSWTYTDAAGTLTATVLPAGVDHGGLGGLGDDDHTIYSLADGTRAFTGSVTIDGDSASNIFLLVENDGTGDALTRWLLTGGQEWSLGIDNSASDAMVLRDVTGAVDVATFQTGAPADSLFVEATTGYLGLGTDNPAYDIHIDKASGAVDLMIETGAAATSQLRLKNTALEVSFGIGSAGGFFLTDLTALTLPFTIESASPSASFIVRGTTGDVSFGAGGSGADVRIAHRSQLLQIAAAASTDTTIQFPAESLGVAVSTRVIFAIPTATTFDVGVSGAATRYASGVSTAAGTTDPGIQDGIRYYSSATAVRITPSSTPATALGFVRVCIAYIVSTPATS